jgi:hypothetical protein
MADKDFVVKNGLVVNSTATINSTGIFYSNAQVANTTFYYRANTALSANNTNNLGGIVANQYVTVSNNYTISGNIAFTAANIYFQEGLRVGNSTSNVVINSNSISINGMSVTAFGGFYKGNFGVIGPEIAKQNLYRINSNTQSNNITIAAGENSVSVGPVIISDGYNLIIQEGGRAVII